MIIPKGKLIAIGGNVDKGSNIHPHFNEDVKLRFFEFGILKRILVEAKGVDSKIEVITTASMIPEEVGDEYLKAFAKLGCNNVQVMHIKNRNDVMDKQYFNRLESCDAIMMTGGNQMRLSAIFGGTDLLKLIQKRYITDNFLIAGTSAGAMAMSNTMIYEGDSSEALLKGTVKITTGLAFIGNVIIDSHFVKRGRFGRLTQAVAANPSCIGVGLGEDTGVLITNGNQMEAVGSGLNLIFDGSNIQYTNIADIEDGEPISIENMVVHVLSKGNFYNLTEKKFHPNSIELLK
jgi:cyanophycinase